MDFSEGYEIVNHELIIGNLEAYGLNEGKIDSKLFIKKKTAAKNRLFLERMAGDYFKCHSRVKIRDYLI